MQRRELISRLKRLGGTVYHYGGEVKIKFGGTTITVGRDHDYTGKKIYQIKQKLLRSGLSKQTVDNTLC